MNDKLNLKKIKPENGQVLLIIVMLLATTLTLIFTISFKSNVDTQLSKLEEESQKALAAAEAGIELALKNGATGTIRLDQSDFSGLGIEGYATVSAVMDKKSFIAPYLNKDEQYTFYLGEYDSSDVSFGNSTSQELTICYTNSPSFTATLVKGTGVTRYTVDNGIELDSGNLAPVGNTTNCPDPEDSSITFSNKIVIPASSISTDSKFITVKSIGEGTYLGFSASGNLPSQGKTITSEVKTKAGVVKKIELFQSHPQIPAEFFVTTF